MLFYSCAAFVPLMLGVAVQPALPAGKRRKQRWLVRFGDCLDLGSSTRWRCTEV